MQTSFIKISQVVTRHILPDGGFRNGTVEEYGQTAIQPEKSATLDCFLDAIDDTVVLLLARFLIQLQLRLDVFSGECDANLDSTRNAT